MTADTITALSQLEADIPLATADTLTALLKLTEDIRRHDAETAAMAAELKRRADQMSRRQEMIEAMCGRASPNPPEPVAAPVVVAPVVIVPAIVEPTPVPAAADAGNLSGWRVCPWTDLEITSPTILKALGGSQLSEIGELADALRLDRAPFGLSEHHADYLAAMIDDVAADDPTHSPILTAEAQAEAQAEPPAVELPDDPPAPEQPPVLKGEPIDDLGVRLEDLEKATSLGCADYGKPLKVMPVHVNGRRYVVAGSVIGGQKYQTYDVLPLHTLAEFKAKHPTVAQYSTLSYPSTAPGFRAPGEYGGLMVTVGRGKSAEVLVVGVKGEQRRLLWENPKGKPKKKAAPNPTATAPPPPAVATSPAPDPTPILDEPFCRPGDVVRTSYGTGPYVVKSIDRVPMLRRHNRPCYSLTVTDVHDPKASSCFLNNYQMQPDGRIDALNGDELIVLPAGAEPGPTYWDWCREHSVGDMKDNAGQQRRWMNGLPPASAEPAAATASTPATTDDGLLRDIPGVTEADADALDAECLWTIGDLKKRIKEKLSAFDLKIDSVNAQIYKVLNFPKGRFPGDQADRIANAIDKHLKGVAAPAKPDKPASPSLSTISRLTPPQLALLAKAGLKTVADLGEACEQVRLKRGRPATAGEPVIDSVIYSFLRESLNATADTADAINAIGDVVMEYAAQEEARKKESDQPAAGKAKKPPNKREKSPA